MVTAIKMLITRHDNIDPENTWLVRTARKFFPFTESINDHSFIKIQEGRIVLTPLFMVLIVIESSDLLFAVDSIPAVFAVTSDPFLVFTSNVFAILGLRSLYFALAGLLPQFRYLKMSLVFLLAYVGVKMMLAHHHPIPNLVSLSIIAAILFVGIAASILGASKDTAALMSPIVDEIEELAETTLRQAKRLIILVIGSTVLVAGAALLILPGPGIPIVIIGLMILGMEFVWARKWLEKIKTEVQHFQEEIRKKLFHKDEDKKF